MILLGASRLLALAGVFLGALTPVSSTGAEVRLQVLSGKPPGRHMLVLTADPGPVYTIEKSTNLVDWLPVLSSPLTNDLLLLDLEVPGATSAFYRGRVGGATNSSSLVQVTLDPSHMGVALITPESGGSCALTNDAGVRVTFTVGPSNVLKAVPVVMTLISQLTGLPETEAPPVAVQFEPDGYEFYGSGTLEILYPTNLTVLAMSSFAFGGDGSELHLMPDVVETNRVLIGITHFSGDGTGGFTGAGRSQMQGRKVNTPVHTAEHSLGSMQAENRQKQREGKTTAEPTPEEWALRFEKVWLDDLLPYVAKASTDCAEARTLTTILRGFELIFEAHTGIKWSNPHLEQLRSDGTAAVWVCNCVQEAQKKCREDDIVGGQGGLTEAEGLRAKLDVGIDQLGACVSPPEITSLETLSERPPCGGLWEGELVFISKYEITYDQDNPAWYNHSTMLELYTYQASVVDSMETYADDNGNLEYDLELRGNITGTYVTTSKSEEKSGCNHKTFSSNIGLPQKSNQPQSAKLHVIFRTNVLDKFEISFPSASVVYNHEFLGTYNRSSALCKVLHPSDDPPQSSKGTNVLSGFDFNSKLHPTQFTINSWTGGSEATADYIINDPSTSTDPIYRKYNTGGERIQLYLNLK